MKSDTDTPEQKLARSNNGGGAQTQRSKLDVIWDEYQAMNRAAGPWGTGIHKPSEAFIDYPHDWRRDAREMGK